MLVGDVVCPIYWLQSGDMLVRDVVCSRYWLQSGDMLVGDVVCSSYWLQSGDMLDILYVPDIGCSVAHLESQVSRQV